MVNLSNGSRPAEETGDPLAGSLPRIEIPERLGFEKLVGGTCNGGQCPTVYQRAGDADNYYIQGYNVEADQLAALSVPNGEGLVRIPTSLIEKLTQGGGL